MFNQTFYKGFSKLLLGLLIALGVGLAVPFAQGQGQIPEIPRLSLTGADGDWDANWYPDGRIWIPPSTDPNHPREFLVPVFIENKWYTREETKDIYIADPIKSFQFKVLYDSSALRAVGVQTFGRRELNYFADEKYKYHTLAKDFNITWMDDKDTSYRKYLNPSTPYQDYTKGRSIRIVGTSTQPLPISESFSVLLYIRFMLVPKAGQPVGIASNTPLIIGTDTIRYNDLNIRLEAPFKKYRPIWKGRLVQQDYPDPSTTTGLAGVDNSPFPNWNDEPHLPGVIYLRISDNVPRFGFLLERGIGLQPAIAQIDDDGALWEMRDPITVDENAPSGIFYGRRNFRLMNEAARTRLLDVEIESDQPWLQFRTVLGPNNKGGCGAPTRYCYIDYIDNNILGDDALGTPIFGRLTALDKEVQIEVRCNPTLLNNPGPEYNGIYVGYITFKSHTADVNPVRLKITFIYFRNPIEWYNNTKPGGINLSLVPKGGFGDPVKLIFGTGKRASIRVDTLFGEYPWESEMPYGEFNARFFPPNNAPAGVKDSVKYGFGNFSPDDDDADGTPKYCVSRDIRSADDTLQSHIFLVRMRVDSAHFYPIVIYWDTEDFPEGANLFLRDTANGQLFPAVNMRRATNLGGTKFSYTITDPRVTSFIIEYTPARVISYLDEYGNPIIKKGWNLLSLPVRPINNMWNVFYPNAINKPFFWSQNQYQFDELLRVGVGYFIKYSDTVDTKFAGSYIYEISVPGSGDSIKLYPGWNTIGCVTTPLSVSQITFTPFGLEVPNPVYVRQHGVWGYKTNRGYEEISELRPGLGYWIKVNAHGYLRLIGREKPIGFDEPSAKERAVEQSIRVNIADNGQHEKTLYLAPEKGFDVTQFELPPIPFSDMFDIRFVNNSLMEDASNPVFKLQGIEYPLSISIDNPRNEYTFVDAITGETLGKIDRANNSIVINKSSNTIRILVSKASELNTLTVYPNPVSGTATLTYTLSQDGQVRIVLSDVLGNEVKTLVDGFAKAGVENHLSINAYDFASGQYLCKMIVNGETIVQYLNIVK